jgi:hypothetical protein
VASAHHDELRLPSQPSAAPPEPAAKSMAAASEQLGYTAVAGLQLRLTFWRADALSAVLEVDTAGQVLSVPQEALYRAGKAL